MHLPRPGWALHGRSTCRELHSHVSALAHFHTCTLWKPRAVGFLTTFIHTTIRYFPQWQMSFWFYFIFHFLVNCPGDKKITLLHCPFFWFFVAKLFENILDIIFWKEKRWVDCGQQNFVFVFVFVFVDKAEEERVDLLGSSRPEQAQLDHTSKLCTSWDTFLVKSFILAIPVFVWRQFRTAAGSPLYM